MIRKTSTDAVTSPESSRSGSAVLLPSNSRIADRLRQPAFWRTWLRRPVLDVAEHLLRLRRLRGMNQEELAEQMGTRQSSVARLETGRSNPRLDTLVKAAEALDAVVRVQFASAEELGPGVLGRNWWDVERGSVRHPDATFDVQVAATSMVTASQAADQVAATVHPFTSFDVTKPPPAYHAAMAVHNAVEISDAT